MIRPLADRVFVRPVPSADTTPSGLAIVDQSYQPETIGDIVAVGEDVRDVKVGDRVLMSPFTGIEARVDHGKETFVVLTEAELLGILE